MQMAAKKNQSSGVAVSAPVARGLVSHRSPPSIVGNPYSAEGVVVIKHREYVCDIVADPSGSFFVQNYALSPNNAALFPWLSQMSVNFDMYQFEAVSFDYETCASTASPGCVIMAIDYDPSDSLSLLVASPVSKQQLMAYNGAQRSPVWQHQCVKANKQLMNRGFVHLTDMGQNFSQDAGNQLTSSETVSGRVYIATMGTSSAVAGELYVNYVVKLKAPQQLSAPGIQLSGHFQFAGTNAAPFTTVSTNTSGATGWANYALVAGAMASSTTTFTTQVVGQWAFMISMTGAAVTNTAPTITAVNGAVISTFDGGSWVGSPATSGLYRFKIITNGNRGCGFSFNPTNVTTLSNVGLRFCTYSVII
jgi:hypothetical protein